MSAHKPPTRRVGDAEVTAIGYGMTNFTGHGARGIH